MEKAHYNVGDLDAGIVDVVLHIHMSAGRSQQAHKGVTQDRVTQVADMSSLVRVDAGVFDENLLFPAPRASLIRFQEQPRRCLAVNTRVDVAMAADLQSRTA